MRTSDHGIDLIKRFEGFSPRAYYCPAGYLTIGYGHVVRDVALRQITTEAAEALLKHDVRIAEAAVRRLITRLLQPYQFDALVSFTFNLGAGALQRSRLRLQVNRGEDARVPDEFMRWVFAGGKRLKGLVARRYAESLMFQGLPWVK